MTAGSQTLSTGAAQSIFSSADAGGPCTTFSITNTDATNDAQINVAGLHATADFFPIKPLQTMVFRSGVNAIQTITGKASAATVAIAGGIVSRL